MGQEQQDKEREEIIATPEGQKVMAIATPLARHILPPAVVPSFLETVKDVWVKDSPAHKSRWIGLANALDQGLLFAQAPARQEERGHLFEYPVREIRTGKVPGSANYYLVYGELSNSNRDTKFAVLLRRNSREELGEIVGMYEKDKGYATMSIAGVQPIEALEQTLGQPLQNIIPTLQ